MRKSFLFLLTVMFIVCSLLGCTLKKPVQNVNLKTEGIYDMRIIRVFGESNLPSGSVFNLVLKEENSEQPIYTETLEVNSKGEFSWTDTNPEPTKVYQIDLVFDPTQQPKKIKDIYGKHGEMIKNDKKNGVVKLKDKVVIERSTTLESLGKKGSVTVNGGNFFLSSKYVTPSN